jgi:hypothetical protein
MARPRVLAPIAKKIAEKIFFGKSPLVPDQFRGPNPMDPPLVREWSAYHSTEMGPNLYLFSFRLRFISFLSLIFSPYISIVATRIYGTFDENFTCSLLLLCVELTTIVTYLSAYILFIYQTTVEDGSLQLDERRNKKRWGKRSRNSRRQVFS